MDKREKKELYQNVFRTPEYFWFSPVSLELQGFALAKGRYGVIEPDEHGRLRSQVLELYHPGVIRVAEALLESNLGYPERALPLLEQALEKLVPASLHRSEYDQALKWLDTGQRVLGDNARLFLLYGMTHYALRDFERAQEALQHALRLDPSLSPRALALLRRIVLARIPPLEQELATDRIVALLEEAIGVDPEFAAYHHHLGRYYFRQGRYAPAIDSLSRAMALDGSLAESLVGLVGEAQMRLDNPAMIHVSFQQGTGVIYVNVRLNGQPESFRFIFDTGASHTAISRALARRMAIAIPTDAPHPRIRTAGGTVQAPLVTLGSVELAGTRVGNVPALILDQLDHADGLLGMSYLRFFTVKIEHDEGYLVLTRK